MSCTSTKLNHIHQRMRPSSCSNTALSKFPDCSIDDLIKHSLKALSVSLAGETELDTKSASIAVVGADTTFKIIEGDKLQTYLDAVEEEGGVEPIAAEDVEMEEPDI